MIQLKRGVRLLGIKSEVWAIPLAAIWIWRSRNVSVVRITAAVDGVHVRASEHYTGLALDLGVHELNALGEDVAQVARDLKEALGDDFDVFHENIGTPDEHIHAHYNPKEAL